MTRRRVRTQRTAAWDRRSIPAMDRATSHGFADPVLGFDTREWLEAVYRANRRRMVERFLARETMLGAFPVSEFEVEDPALRARAQAVLDAERERWRRDPRELLR